MKPLYNYLIESGTPGIEKDTDVIDLMMSMQKQGVFTVEKTEGDYMDVRYEMHYKRGLIHWIEFVNPYEYLDGYIGPDGIKIDNRSTEEVDRTDWELMLHSDKMIPICIKNLTKRAGREKGKATRYKNSYDRNGSGSSYSGYIHSQNSTNAIQSRLEKYRMLQKYV